MQIQEVVDDTLDMTDHGLFITWWHNVHVFKVLLVLLVLAILVGLDRHLRQTFPLQADEDDRRQGERDHRDRCRQQEYGSGKEVRCSLIYKTV